VALVSQWAQNGAAPAQLSRPFDKKRSGMVAGEGAGAIMLEEFSAAETRGATIYGEVLGHGSSMAIDRNCVADIRRAVANATRAALRRAKMEPTDLGHVHAHGSATRNGDIAETLGLADVLGNNVPLTTAKGAMGNIGAAGGVVELVASLVAIRDQRLFPILNCDSPDPACPMPLVTQPGTNAGATVLSINYTPQGQASALIARGYPN
jgi:3-oxoacyl-[acyl-carrier-protein] synthase II